MLPMIKTSTLIRPAVQGYYILYVDTLTSCRLTNKTTHWIG